jgi:polar amino acid transport system substrate-binding protein
MSPRFLMHGTASAAALLALAVLAGCGSAKTTADTPVAAQGVPAAAKTAPVDRSCGDATASLRPFGSLPDPGKLPDGSFMAKIAARGRLVVGTSQDALLFSSRNPFTGEIEGADIDLAHEVAKAIFGDPNKIQIVIVPNSARESKVRDGTVDIVAETMTVNCSRRKNVDFSSVYYSAGQKILVPMASPAKSLADLGNQRVCAVEGSTSMDVLKAAGSHPSIVPVATWGDCLVAFQQNKADAISTDDTILIGLATQDPYARVVGDRFTEEPYGLAISRKHPDFTRFVNGVLARIRADGTWAKIYVRWFGQFGPTPAPPVARYRD